MKKVLLGLAALLFLVPMATPANAQVVVRVGPRYHHHHHYYHHYHHGYYRHY